MENESEGSPNSLDIRARVATIARLPLPVQVRADDAFNLQNCFALVILVTVREAFSGA
jgi:hypothetical protein